MRSILVLAFYCIPLNGIGQILVGNLGGQTNINTINTALPFLRINPFASTSGFGEIDVVATKDNHNAGLFSNPALLATGEKVAGIKSGFNPWLRQRFDGIYLLHVGSYYSIDNKNTIGFGMRYFKLGKILFPNPYGSYPSRYKSQQFDITMRAAHRFGNNISLGVGGHYIHSNLTTAGHTVNGADIFPVNSFAFDLGLETGNQIDLNENTKFHWSLGFSTLNLGPKISYTGRSSDKAFIPSTMLLGYLNTFEWERVDLTWAYQFEKLLVPTPDSAGDYKSKSSFEGIFTSFGDAPGGVSEELKEIIHRVGLEAKAKFQEDIALAIRFGRFIEHFTKGNRNYWTVGTGIHFFGANIDFSYIVPRIDRPTPLDNTWKIGAGYTYYFKNE